jgi:hypothetical protein
MKRPHIALLQLFRLVIILPVLLPVAGYSQDSGSCAEKLKNAQSLFEKGQVEQVPPILFECMKSGFNREESLSAYKLLIQSYLFEEKPDLADSTMLSFLRKNPEYKVSPTDHPSFVYLFNKFRVRPVVQISLHLGTNLPFVTFINPFNVVSISGESVYSSNALNLFTAVEARFELNIEAGFSQLTFTNVVDFMGIGKTTYTETQRRLEFPLSMTYNFTGFGKLTPYARFGFGPALLLGSTAQAEYKTVALNGTPVTGPDLDRKNSRIKIDLFAQIGGGMKFKTRGGFAFGEIRSGFGIRNQTVRGDLINPDQSTDDLLHVYKYEDDDFHLNSLNFSLGYTLIFYKPSKRRE